MQMVLQNIKSIIDNNMPSEYNIKSTQIGTPDEFQRGLLINTELPCILVTPNGQPQRMAGPWANHMTITYSVLIYIITYYQIPNTARISLPITNQGKTIYNIADQLRNIFGNNKQLNGAVRTWSTQWATQDLTDEDGNQIYQVTTNWSNDLAPWDGVINNQQTIIP